MPAMNFYVRWPDGSEDCCYSPSTVITQHLAENNTYTVISFVQRCHQALNQASQRVEQKFGYFCSSAMDQLGAIQAKASHFMEHPDAEVTVIRIVPHGGQI